MVDHWDIVIRLLLSGLFSGLIGLEREAYRKPAGLRTHILVGVGSAIFMIMSVMLVRLEEGGISVDASRIAAGVVTGIGFLGAGTIIRSGEGVRGLTTAASVWTASAIGLAVGAGYVFLAAMGSILVVLVLFLLSRLEKGHGLKQEPKRTTSRKKTRVAREDF